MMFLVLFSNFRITFEMQIIEKSFRDVYNLFYNDYEFVSLFSSVKFCHIYVCVRQNLCIHPYMYTYTRGVVYMMLMICSIFLMDFTFVFNMIFSPFIMLLGLNPVLSDTSRTMHFFLLTRIYSTYFSYLVSMFLNLWGVSFIIVYNPFYFKSLVWSSLSFHLSI